VFDVKKIKAQLIEIRLLLLGIYQSKTLMCKEKNIEDNSKLFDAV
jgi:hypothetical protein